MKRIVAAMVAVILIASYSHAQIVVDGELDKSGYSLAAVQTNNTQFGDASGDPMSGNMLQGSELDAMYTAVEGTRLFVMLTGNLEGNFNKLEVFFDTVEGGENILSSTPEYDFEQDSIWQSQRLGDIIEPDSVGPGFTFDKGFECDFHLFFRRGFEASSPTFNVFDADFINRDGGTNAIITGNDVRTDFDFDLQTAAGSIVPGSLANNASGDAITKNIDVAFNNNNNMGVVGYNDMDPQPVDEMAALAVTTGIEFSIDVCDLGLDPKQAGTIKICVVQNGGAHDFVSNQTLPGLPFPQGNLGGDNMGNFIGDCDGVDLAALAGDQFFCINYDPGGDCDFEIGDINEDGLVNLEDVDPFVQGLAQGIFLCQADINGDGLFNLEDVDPFVTLLAGG